MKQIRRVLRFFGEVWKQFLEDEVLIRAASVAFFAALSLAPLVLLFVGLSELIGSSTQQQMIRGVESSVGPQARRVVEGIAVRGRKRVDHASWTLAVTGVVLLFSASGVLAALQAGLNRVWHVKAKPGHGVRNWLRKRLLSMAMVLAIGFLLLLSLILTSVLSILIPPSGWGLRLVNAVSSLVVFVLLFAALFKVLPDVEIAWRDVWFGAVVTGLMFAVGKYFTGQYIARADYSSSYGAAGSIVVILIWVFYGSLILLIGAEVTQVRLRRLDREIEPDEHSERLDASEI
jgi:membrane protein